MKYTILINQLGIVDAGLHTETDLIDWALLEYVCDWQVHGRAERMRDHVWLNYQNLIDEMPMVGLGKKNSVSNRVKKLVGLGLVSVLHDEFGRVFVRTTDLYHSVCRFRPGDGVSVKKSTRSSRGTPVPHEEHPVPHEEHSTNNNKQITRNKLPVTNTHTEISEAVKACVIFTSAGIIQSNSSHPDLLELIAKGATAADFEFAGKTAVERGKGFGYALGIVRSCLADRQAREQSQQSGGNHAGSGGFKQNSRLEHQQRIRAELDRQLEEVFGEGAGGGVVRSAREDFSGQVVESVCERASHG